MGGDSVPDECIRLVFRALVEEGEAGKAKTLVAKYGDTSSYLEELLQVSHTRLYSCNALIFHRATKYVCCAWT